LKIQGNVLRKGCIGWSGYNKIGDKAMPVLLRETHVRNRAMLLALIAGLDKPVRGIHSVIAMAFLANCEGLPIDYEYESVGEGLVISESLFSDLMDLIDQGFISEVFERKGETIIPILESLISSSEAIDYVRDFIKDDTVQKLKAFISKMQRETSSGKSFENIVERVMSDAS